MILLNTGLTTTATTVNPKLVTYIRMVINPVGITTNSGTEWITLEETAKVLGHA